MTQSDLRHILDRTLVVIQVGAGLLELAYGTEVTRRPGYRAALVEVAITLNAALTAHGLYQSFELASRGGIDVIFQQWRFEIMATMSPDRTCAPTDIGLHWGSCSCLPIACFQLPLPDFVEPGRPAERRPRARMGY
jgi:hypothetical protein